MHCIAPFLFLSDKNAGVFYKWYHKIMTIYAATFTLLLILDPVGNIPMFLSLLKRVEPRRRKQVIIREMLFALLILVFFLFFGSYILNGMHISGPALGISGGIILFLTAIRMIFPPNRDPDNVLDVEPMLVPLAVPLIAGPSAIATVILFSTTLPDQRMLWLLGILFAWFITAAVLVASDTLRKMLGDQMLEGIERLMGLILTALSVQMLLAGIQQFLAAL